MPTATIEIVMPTKFTVIMEKYNCERSKRATVLAYDAYQAMAIAQSKHRGWMPVDVIAA